MKYIILFLLIICFLIYCKNYLTSYFHRVSASQTQSSRNPLKGCDQLNLATALADFPPNRRSNHSMRLYWEAPTCSSAMSTITWCRSSTPSKAIVICWAACWTCISPCSRTGWTKWWRCWRCLGRFLYRWPLSRVAMEWILNICRSSNGNGLIRHCG